MTAFANLIFTFAIRHLSDSTTGTMENDVNITMRIITQLGRLYRWRNVTDRSRALQMFGNNAGKLNFGSKTPTDSEDHILSTEKLIC